MDGRVGTNAVWTVIVPLQRASAAKSRLGGEPIEREEVARALARTVVDAAVACPAVRRTVVVTPEPEDWAELRAMGAELVAEESKYTRTDDETADAGGRRNPVTGDDEPSARGPGMDRSANDTLNDALHVAAAQMDPGPLAIVVADLPLISADALAAVLSAADGSSADDAGSDRGTGVFVPDSAGSGTCVVAYRQGPYAFRFGPDSARKHRELGLSPVTSVPELRVDLDTADDLASMRAAWVDATGGTGTAPGGAPLAP